MTLEFYLQRSAGTERWACKGWLLVRHRFEGLWLTRPGDDGVRKDAPSGPFRVWKKLHTAWPRLATAAEPFRRWCMAFGEFCDGCGGRVEGGCLLCARRADGQGFAHRAIDVLGVLLDRYSIGPVVRRLEAERVHLANRVFGFKQKSGFTVERPCLVVVPADRSVRVLFEGLDENCRRPSTPVWSLQRELFPREAALWLRPTTQVPASTASPPICSVSCAGEARAASRRSSSGLIGRSTSTPSSPPVAPCTSCVIAAW